MLRSTAFDPFGRAELKLQDPSINFSEMEQALAKEMARMKIVDEQKKRQIQKIAAESDEIKELQAKIKAAQINKERSAQVAETQFRK